MDQIMSTLLGVVIGGVAPWPLKALWRMVNGSSDRHIARDASDARAAESEAGRLSQRNGDLEDLIDTLRKALDRHLIRESAIASACELLIMVAAMVPRPSEAMLRIRDRAQQLLEDARAQTSKTNGRGDA